MLLGYIFVIFLLYFCYIFVIFLLYLVVLEEYWEKLLVIFILI